MGDDHDDGQASFDAVVGPYSRTRPGYPDEALDWLAARAGLGPGSRVLDLAAGTGKLTASLVARGYEVTAVEPLPGMRAQLARDVPAARVLAGRAEQIPLGDRSIDVVCVGQAFHWFEPQPALDEIVRVLAPAGSLALCWNLWDLADPAQAALDRIVAPLETGRIRHLTTGNHPYGSWSEVLAADERLEAVATARFAHSVELDAAAAAERVASMSQVESAPERERVATIAAARELVQEMPSGRGVFRYQTEIDIRRRRVGGRSTDR
jgi:SAM-dependent methyltransferase